MRALAKTRHARRERSPHIGMLHAMLHAMCVLTDCWCMLVWTYNGKLRAAALFGPHLSGRMAHAWTIMPRLMFA